MANLTPEPSLQLYDPRKGDWSLRLECLVGCDAKPQRSNYFTIYWVRQGRGRFCAGISEHPFVPDTLLFLVPYQSFRFMPDEPLSGFRLQFHANFLCIETHHEEVGCNGVLFNDTYGVPCVHVDGEQIAEFANLFERLQCELREGGLAQSEVLLSYLKILLVRATRLKLQQQEVAHTPQGRVPDTLAVLKDLIEQHYRAHHAPADYARMLHIAPKSLARLVRLHLNKTLTELIRERVAKEAKWQMLHTLKPVKQVATELGFDDIFYFSRFFKRATGCSPTFFREYETRIRDGRNLSME